MSGLAAGLAIAGSGLGLISGIQNLMQPGIQREREDNAVQRRTEDMLAAGINPILAAGNPAQATPIQSRAGDMGAMVDYMAKKATVDLQKKQQDLLDAQKQKVNMEKDMMRPQWLKAQNEFGLLHHIFNSGRGYDGKTIDEFQRLSLEGTYGPMRDQKALYDMAQKYNVPSSMLGSMGPVLAMNEILSTASPQEKARLLLILGAMGGAKMIGAK